jgi:glycosyltransferase involved in cell wall biosynthesis
MVAPPWIPVPPPGYGGIEAVAELLCDELVARGHDVTLFAAPGSRSAAHVRTVLDAAHPDTIGSALHESDHVASVWDAIDEAADRGAPFDVVHDHSGFTAVAMAGRVGVPVVHTLHGPLEGDSARFYERHGKKVHLVAISRSQIDEAPLRLRVAAVVPNPIALERWPLSGKKDDYALWIGRMDPIKGAHRAIEAARRAGHRLVLAGPVQSGQSDFFRSEIEPHIDGDRVRYVGEVAGVAKQRLYAHARALLMPIRWREPFGMVMIEALASGTPVLAFPEGAAAEIVIDGHNGMLVADEAEMARALASVDTIDPRDCRDSVRSRYDVAITANGYEAVYRRAMRIGTSRFARREARVSRLSPQSAGVASTGSVLA